MDSNSPGGRGGRDSDNWTGRGGGRDSDKWGGRGGGRDPDGWGGRGSRISSWRGVANRRRNDEWEEPPFTKRWRRGDMAVDRNEMSKSWKSGKEEGESLNNKQGSPWMPGKKDDGNNSKFKSRDNNEERSNRKPSKWGDKESDDKVKEDRWNRDTSTKDELNSDASPHQTSAPMDLDNYEGEAVDNIDQPQEETHVKELSSINEEISLPRNSEVEGEIQNHPNLSGFNANIYDQDEENLDHSFDKQNNDKQLQFEDQNNYSNNSSELPRDNFEEVQQNLNNQPLDNFKPQIMEQRPNNEFPDNYKIDSHDDYNTQHNYETNQKDKEFEQNSQFESDYNNVAFENEQQNYDQSYEEEPSHNSNKLEQSLTNDIVSQVDDNNHKGEHHAGEICSEPLGNFYFGTESESINKSAEVEQNSSDFLPPKEAIMVPPESDEINTAETNQS